MISQTLSLETFLTTYREALCSSSAFQLQPLIDREQIGSAAKQLRGLHQPLFAKQIPVTAAMAYAIMHPPYAGILQGEMSVGKTRMAIGTTLLTNLHRILVLLPPHLVQKWKREIHDVLPHAPVTILRSIHDVDAFVHTSQALSGPCFALLNRERAKLGYRRKPALHARRRRYEPDQPWDIEYACVHCGIPPRNDDDRFLTPATVTPHHRCRRCHATFFTFDPNGPRRVPLADYIARRHTHAFDLLIADELHEFSKKSSSQAFAFDLLRSKIPRTLGLTGTLSNGKATSLFFLGWRLFTPLRQTYRYHDEAKWVDRYGVWETTTHVPQTDTVQAFGKQSKRKVYHTVKERPGLSPEIIPLLMSHTAFFRMEDLGEALVPLHSDIQEVPLVDPIQQPYTQLQTVAKDLVLRARQTKDGHLLSTTMQALLTYPDHAWNGLTLTDKYGATLFSLPPITRDWVSPKEQRLLDLILHNRHEGRKVLVYATFTNKKQILSHLHQRCRTHHIRAQILPRGIRAEHREAWIAQHVHEFDVLFTNPRCVQTGLDLTDFPTIIFYEPEYSIYATRQASRRSWRIGQTKPVTISSLLYTQTAQERAWALIAGGIKQSLLLEGDMPTDELATYQQSDNILHALVEEILTHQSNLPTAEQLFRDIQQIELAQDQPHRPPHVAQSHPRPFLIQTPGPTIQLSLFSEPS